MSIQSLVPVNTTSVMSTAVSNFKKFLASKFVTVEQLNMSILSDPSGACFVALMEKFAMYLAYIKGSNGEFLAKKSVFSITDKWISAALILCVTKTTRGRHATRDGAHSGETLHDKSEGRTCEESCILYKRWFAITYGLPLHDCHKLNGLQRRCTCVSHVAFLRPGVWTIAGPQSRSIH